jgi:hypothetical protein
MNIVQIYRDVIKFFERHNLSISPQHKRYLKHARRELVRLYPTEQDQEMLDPYSDLILSLFLLDLEALRPQFQAFYHPKPRGALPRDPIQMFRSPICTTLSGQTLSFTAWVKVLRSQPLFAALSGFEDRTPGIGAFYDFSRRLFPETTDSIIRQAIFKPKVSDKDRRPRPGIARAPGHKSSRQPRPAIAGFSSPATQSPAKTHRLAFSRPGSALLF